MHEEMAEIMILMLPVSVFHEEGRKLSCGCVFGAALFRFVFYLAR